ncbi:lipopolysaccharide biosynthesis protein [Consotaella aegiceratis]|uniref:lipopolysaccharide biosynthesis protein n=1 Tax=Consotaella aegiceratis TaxID=3097961 RepID=UPI002F400FC7
MIEGRLGLIATKGTSFGWKAAAAAVVGRTAKLRAFTSRPFVRNVATVATGTAAAQAISMAFAPLITRMYGPEAYGLQGIFNSVVSLFGVVAAMGYPIAIVLPRRDNEAIGIAKLSMLTAVATCLLATLVLSVFGAKILRLLNAEAIAGFIYIIPIAVFVGVLGSVLGQWLIRKKAYGVSARYSVVTAFLVGSSKYGLGFAHPGAIGLILANTVGALVGVLLTFTGWRRHARKSAEAEAQPSTQVGASLGALAREHYDFPLLRTPQNLINALSQSLPMLLLAAYFGPGAAGQYSIVIAVLGIPITLIGGSVTAVFYPRINEAIHNGENARSLIVRATVGMAATGALPFLAVMVAGPWLFALVFGAGWRTAGEYGQWLSLWLFFQYINRPAVSAIPALKLQGGLLVYEIASTGTKVLALWLGFVIFGSDIAAVALFSIFGIVAYAWLILWVIQRSGKPIHE